MKCKENFLSVRHAGVPVTQWKGKDPYEQSMTQTRFQSCTGMWLENEELRALAFFVNI